MQLQKLKINLNPLDKYVKTIGKKTIPGKKYSVSTSFIGNSGTQFSAFFGVYMILPDKVESKVCWLNDFSGKKISYNIVFEALTEKVIITYRINFKTPIRSKINCEILPLKNISFTEVSSKKIITSDSFNQFSITDVPNLNNFELEKLESNLVWLLASPRSGTTWLGTKLLSYQSYSIDEPKIGFHFRDVFSSSLDPKLSSTISDSDDYFFSDNYANNWIPNLKKLILNRIFSQIHDIDNKIIIKEPHGSNGGKLISKTFPNSKLLLLIRDGRDVLDSTVDGISVGGWITRTTGRSLTDKERIRFIKKNANQWTELVTILLDTYENYGEKNKLMIKYEDLRYNTKPLLRKIYDFIDIDIPENELETLVDKNSFENIPVELKGKGKSIRSATPGKWKQNFSNVEKELINQIMLPTLKKLGYD